MATSNFWEAMFELKFYAKELSQKYGMEIALARTPAETTAQRFAVSDLLHDEFRKCAEPLIKGNVPEALRRIHETRDLPIYYTNGTHVPPSAEVSLPQRIKLEETFFPIVDGGNILHIWLGEAAPDPHGLKEFTMNIATLLSSAVICAVMRCTNSCPCCFIRQTTSSRSFVL